MLKLLICPWSSLQTIDVIVLLGGILDILLLIQCSKGILESLRKRAHMMTDGFNSCKNVVCNFTEG